MIIFMFGLWQIFCWMRQWLNLRTTRSATETPSTTGMATETPSIPEAQGASLYRANEARHIYIKEKGYAYHTHEDCETLKTRSPTMRRIYCKVCEARTSHLAAQSTKS